jgi:nucleoside phosphorylase
VIHAGIKIRELLDAAVAATAGVRRGLRGCGTWQSVPVVSNHTLNTLLLGELSARRLRSRMGIVYTTANRNWELHLALVEDRLRQSRALAVDMESATVAANGFRYRIPTATLLAVSDKPLHAEPKLSADAQDFYAASRRQHVEIAISVTERSGSCTQETACHTGRNNCSLAELIRFRGARRRANEDRRPAA